jgi:hypothetical protein
VPWRACIGWPRPVLQPLTPRAASDADILRRKREREEHELRRAKRIGMA